MKWVYKMKTTTNGNVKKLKVSLVAQGFEQWKGIDYKETFAPIVKWATICMVFALVVQHNWNIKHKMWIEHFKMMTL
jgi:hypothetical protein